MNFLKSVFSEEEASSENPNPNNTNQWSFNNILETYKNELNELTSGLKAETELITAAAARAARDLPGSIETAAAAAQNSLETVGDAIDTFGFAVAHIIRPSLRDEESNDNRDLGISRSYSRLESMIRSIQCDMNTYVKEVEEVAEYEEWRLGFDLGEKKDAIEGLIEENAVMREIFDEVVPRMVDWETFWTRYFFKVYKITKAEEARANIVRRAVAGEEEEELSWDVDDEEEEKEIGIDEGEKRLDTISKKDDDFMEAKEEDIDWDEIEDKEAIGNGNPNIDELRKKLSALGKKEEEEEDLGWDIEDDDEPLKS